MTGVNQAQQDAWNGDSGQRWVADADRRDAVLGPVADALLAAARLQPGDTVLDLGCGCGATTLAAADLVAPANVVGLDLSGPMLELARQRTGTGAATFIQADAQTKTFDGERFDVAIGRSGTMFFDDPVAAFTNIATAVRPGGRLCLAAWQALDANEWLLVPGAVLLEHCSRTSGRQAPPRRRWPISTNCSSPRPLWGLAVEALRTVLPADTVAATITGYTSELRRSVGGP